MLTFNDKGAIAETATAAEAVRLGIFVLRPVVDGRRYDLVFDMGARLLRIQCKWARLRDDVVQTSLRTNRTTPAGYVRPTAYTRSTPSLRGVPSFGRVTCSRSTNSRAARTPICGRRRPGTTSASVYTGPLNTSSGL
jgi:hypothetical protein